MAGSFLEFYRVRTEVLEVIVRLTSGVCQMVSDELAQITRFARVQINTMAIMHQPTLWYGTGFGR